MLKRIKNLWKLSDAQIVERGDEQVVIEVIGDEKAEFIPMGTEEDFKKQEQKDKGMEGIFGL